MWPFSQFQYDFRSSQLTTDLLIVVSNRIAGAFNGFFTCLGLLELKQLIYLRLLTGFGMLVFFKNLSLTEF